MTFLLLNIVNVGQILGVLLWHVPEHRLSMFWKQIGNIFLSPMFRSKIPKSHRKKKCFQKLINDWFIGKLLKFYC